MAAAYVIRRINFVTTAFPAPSAASTRRYFINFGRPLQGSTSGSVPGQAPYSACDLPKPVKTGGGAYHPDATPSISAYPPHTGTINAPLVTIPHPYKHRGELSVISPPRAASSHHFKRTSMVVWRRHILSLPPRRRASPSIKKIGLVCSRRSASLHSGLAPRDFPIACAPFFTGPMRIRRDFNCC
jgi:hypothetical protein